MCKLILVVEWMKLHVYLMEKVIQPPLGFELTNPALSPIEVKGSNHYSQSL